MTYSTNLLSKIIHSVFTAQDHRKYILAIINERFVKQVDELIENIFEYKKQGKNWVQIINAHYEKSEDKKKIAWLAGLNQKTILNMSCKHNNIPVKKPESKIRFEKIYKIINDAQEKSPDLDLLRKLKSL